MNPNTYWQVLGESVAGTAHVKRTIPCQDAFGFQRFGPEDGWLVVAVADGAGSASHSDVGSRIACDELVRYVVDLPPETDYSNLDVSRAFAGAREAVCAKAAELGLRPRDLAATALLAVVGPESAVFGQVGDGAIVIGDGSAYRTVFWPEIEEFVNVTNFLTETGFERHLLTTRLGESIRDLALMTDGVQWLALDFALRQPHPEFFRPMFVPLRGGTDMTELRPHFRSFLDSDRVNEKTDDDKTLFLASRCPRHAAAELPD